MQEWAAENAENGHMNTLPVAISDAEIMAVQFSLCCGWMMHPTEIVAKWYILQQKYLKWIGTALQLSTTPYTDPEHHNAQCYWQTDSDNIISYHIISYHIISYHRA